MNLEPNPVVNKGSRGHARVVSDKCLLNTIRVLRWALCTSYWPSAMQIRPNNSPSTAPFALIRCSETIIQSRPIGTCSIDTGLVRECFISVLDRGTRCAKKLVEVWVLSVLADEFVSVIPIHMAVEFVNIRLTCFLLLFI